MDTFAGTPLPRIDPEFDPNPPLAPWWKCFVAAAPTLLLGTQFLVVALTGKAFFFATPQALTAVMQAEFLVIHSVFFLGMFAFYRPAGVARRAFRAAAFWGLFAFYVYHAMESGLDQALTFVTATFVTYLGVFLNWHSPSALLQLAVRYAVCFPAFILIPKLFDAPGNVGAWTGLESVLQGGAAYFLLLGALELSGLYLRFIPRYAPRLLESWRNAENAE